MHFICCNHYIQTVQSGKRLVLNSSVSLTIVLILSGWRRLQSYTHWLFSSNKRLVLLIGYTVFSWAAFNRQVNAASGIKWQNVPFSCLLIDLNVPDGKCLCNKLKREKYQPHRDLKLTYAFYVPPMCSRVHVEGVWHDSSRSPEPRGL